MPSMSDVAKTEDIEFQEITENVARSTDNLIKQLEGESSEDLPMHELVGLDKQLGSIRGSLRWRWQNRFSQNNASSEKSVSSRKSETIRNATMAFDMTSGSKSLR